MRLLAVGTQKDKRGIGKEGEVAEITDVPIGSDQAPDAFWVDADGLEVVEKLGVGGSGVKEGSGAVVMQEEVRKGVRLKSFGEVRGRAQREGKKRDIPLASGDGVF